VINITQYFQIIFHFFCSNFAVIINVYLSALFIGISLGLIGSGGSILTLPTMIYLLKQIPKWLQVIPCALLAPLHLLLVFSSRWWLPSYTIADIFLRLPVKKALGTSFFIIAFNALIAFSWDALNGIALNF
jgi:uncharacterized membrane protein YfcA